MLRQRTRHIRALSEIADWSKPAIQNPDPSFNVQELLQSLPASEQVVLSLRIIHDMPFRDIATVVGISTEAAKKRAQRGLRALREKMRDSEHTSEKTNVRALVNKSSGFSKTTSPNRPTKRT
jgi:DNA-directed RNA polymerase specialized sigma24 family protein